MAKGDEYNPVSTAEACEAVGKVALIVSGTLSMRVIPERERLILAAEVERATIQAMKVAARPLLAEIAHLQEQMTLTRAAAKRERERMAENVNVWRTRAQEATETVESLLVRVKMAEDQLAEARLKLAET